MLMVCPRCNGRGTVAEQAPVELTAMEYTIWDIVRRAEGGISFTDLVDEVYANRKSPGKAKQSVCVTICNANKRLATVRLKIVSTRGRKPVYTLQNIDDK